MKIKPHSFATFPEFSRLTLADRERYEAWIADMPPVYDLSFPGLMTLWNPMDNASVAQLNGNLVIPYWLPGDEKRSGLSLVGTNKIDETICDIFDYLRSRGEPVKLVNVPDFVIKNIAYFDMFKFHEEQWRNEYLLTISDFYPLKNMSGFRRRIVERALNKMGEENMVVRSLDLALDKNRHFLRQATVKWYDRGINNFGRLEREAIYTCLDHAEELGLENLCLFVNGELYGFCLYKHPHDKRYIILRHVKATHPSARRFELIAYKFAEWFAGQNVAYANITADLGVPRVRMLALSLGPSNFFRKYTIKPIE